MPPQHATVAPSVRSARLPTPSDAEAARIFSGILLLIGVGGMRLMAALGRDAALREAWAAVLRGEA